MNENPINNEPGYETADINDKKSSDYNEYIRFNKYNFAIYEMLVDKKKFPYFTDVIENYFVKNYKRIRSKLENLVELDGNEYKTFIWNHNVKVDYKNLILKFDHLYENLKNKDFSNVSKSSVHQCKSTSNEI